MFDDWDEESERIAIELENRATTSILVKPSGNEAVKVEASSSEVLDVIAREEKEIEALVNPVEKQFIGSKDPRSLWFV